MEALKREMEQRGYEILGPITKGWSSDKKFLMSSTGRRASGFARSCHRAMQQYDGFEREIPLWYERYKNR